MNSFPKSNIKETFIMGTFIACKSKHVHKLSKFLWLQMKLLCHDSFISRLHILIKVFYFTESEDIYQNPQRDVAMFGHIMGHHLMMFAYLTRDFLLYITNKFYGR